MLLDSWFLFKLSVKGTLKKFNETKFNSKVALIFIQIGSSTEVYSRENISLQIRSRRTKFINMGLNEVGIHVFHDDQRRWTKSNAGIGKRGRERGLFWVHRQEHWYKGARKFHVILCGTIFRTVGARVEIDVWASLSYSHLHWWLHARPLSRALEPRSIHNKW